MAVATADIKGYQEAGCLCPLLALTPAQIAPYRQAWAAIAGRMAQPLRQMAHPHRYFPWAFELATHPRILDAAEKVIGPDLLVHSVLVLAKYPRDPSFVSWHQDGEHSGWYRSPAVSAWLALSESNPENGCMRVIPGTHVKGRYGHRYEPHPDNLIRDGQQVEGVATNGARDLVLKPGEFSLHHPNIVHGSRPNPSGAMRIGFIIRYVTPDYRFPGPSHPMLDARGRADRQCHAVFHQPLHGSETELFEAWLAGHGPGGSKEASSQDKATTQRG